MENLKEINMIEIENLKSLIKGRLLTKEDAKTALLILFGINNKTTIEFTNKELFKIYIDVMCRHNVAPEENEDFEIELAQKILDKLKNSVA